MLHPPSHVGFPKRCHAKPPISLIYRKPKKRSAVICPDIFTAPPQHILIATHLHVPVHKKPGNPKQRTEPVQTENRERDQLYEVISSCDVMLLVFYNIILFFLRKTKWDINARFYKSHDKRRRDAVAFIYMIPQQYRCSDSPFH